MDTCLHRLRRTLAAFSSILLLGALVPQSLAAQCATPWLPGSPLTSPGGLIHASLAWDPDGAGPAPAVAVVGGDFRYAGGVAAANIAIYDPAQSSWSALGAGFDAPVLSLHVDANGQLVAGGLFANSGATACRRIARWNGTSWSALGQGLQFASAGAQPASVDALASLPNGDLVAGGAFDTAGATACSSVARWDGATWSSLGAGLSGSVVSPTGSAQVLSLLVRGSGDLIAGGSFYGSGGVASAGLMRWDGAAWQPLPPPALDPLDGKVTALAELPIGGGGGGGDLVVAANFASSPYSGVAAFDGAIWTSMGGGLERAPEHLLLAANGQLLAAGFALLAPTPFDLQALVAWNGSTWQPFVQRPPHLDATTVCGLPNGELLIASNDGFGRSASRWTGAQWLAPAIGTDGEPWRLLAGPGGSFVAAGLFASLDGVPANNIAEWDGANWQAMGSGLTGVPRALARQPNGDLLVAGSFPSGTVTFGLMRWDGVSWSAVPSVLGDGSTGAGYVNDLVVMPNGDLVIAGDFISCGGVLANGIARFDGASWSALGQGLSCCPNRLLVRANGELVAAGRFFQAGGASALRIARWDGSSWSTLGAGLSSASGYAEVWALANLPNGDLVVGGDFSTTGSGQPLSPNIAVWDGANWSSLGAGLPSPVHAIETLPGGDLVAGGVLIDYLRQDVPQPWRWDGAAWSSSAAGIEPNRTGVGRSLVADLCFTGTGELVAVGNFVAADGQPASGLARQVSACPAQAVEVGPGCAGSLGAVTQTVAGLAWLGGTFRSVTANLPATSLAVGVRGLATVSLPLAAILPEGLPGCVLHVRADLTDLYLPSGGEVVAAFAIPNATVLLGQKLLHQVLPVELDAAGAIAAVSASNALELTIGAF